MGADAEIYDREVPIKLPNPTYTGVRDLPHDHDYPTNIVFGPIFLCRLGGFTPLQFYFSTKKITELWGTPLHRRIPQKHSLPYFAG